MLLDTIRTAKAMTMMALAMTKTAKVTMGMTAMDTTRTPGTRKERADPRLSPVQI